jgi:hypothetical protein
MKEYDWENKQLLKERVDDQRLWREQQAKPMYCDSYGRKKQWCNTDVTEENCVLKCF